VTNPIAEEILAHIGMPRRSGRYPWGSGGDPYQHGSRDFYGRIEELKKSGWKETPENIMKEFGLTTTQYRVEKSLAKDERRMLNVAKAKSLKEDGLGDSEIGRQMGVNESTVRSWLNEKSEMRMNQAQKTADFIREQIDKKGMIDVGADVNRELGISDTKMKEALYILEREGYPVYGGRMPQTNNPGKHTTLKVICPPGTEHKEIYEFDKVHSLNDYVSHDGGDTFDKFVYPASMDSKRLKIRYAEEGGVDKDGIVELRRGVDDLSLGESKYSQVRILVDGNKYIKGMAVYSDNMPDGVDVVFNTNKSSDVPMGKVLKDIKSDPENPFGSLIKAGGQSYYIDKDGNRQLSLINKRADEGDWTEWKDALPSQFLGKQSLSLAKKQLGLAKADKEAEFNEICELTNPTIKKHLLEEFANNCDSAATHLKASALPGQKYHVIIPVNTLKDNEIYAPNYENGTQLALVRYPHGGTFEIPVLTVNNKHAAARDLIGEKSIDAVGINKKIADRLSGADFDGDTVMCLPTNNGKVKITSTNELQGLKGFDPKLEYGSRLVPAKDSPDGKDHYYRGDREIRIMTNTNTQMGVISNLITDMTLGGATQDELARAVRHSMVVIDAEKHKLDYKQSEQDNDIAGLKNKYQRKIDSDGNVRVGGASTILSRAKGESPVVKRQGTPQINQKGKPWYDPNRPEGALIYKRADDAEYQVRKVNKRTGEETVVTKIRTQKSTKMAETDDAYTLVSEARHPMEMLYADYANSMKALANKARMEQVNTGKIAYSAAAKATYAKEVQDLEVKLDTAERNRPRERAAMRMANAAVKARKEADPNATKDDLKKTGQQALTKYRSEVGAVARSKRNIDITDREWEAIQAGAISETKLKRILRNTDADKLRERATPRTTTTLSAAKMSKIKSMSASNKYSLAEIAAACGCSTATVSKYLKGAS
jgi:DNA-binding CsgD family transcriptional regulator